MTKCYSHWGMGAIIISVIMFAFICAVFHRQMLEGMDNPDSTPEYKDYSHSDPLILAQQNAGNISFLKQQVDGLPALTQQVKSIQDNINSLQDQINQLASAQQDYATQLVGTTPPTITGADST